MPGLRWTRTGAVSLPDTLQIRIDPDFSGRIRAQAPTPGRALSDAEVDDNLVHFCRPGPRGRPVAGLVLSGLPDRDLTALEQAVAQAESVSRLVVHADAQSLSRLAQARGLLAAVDVLALAVRDPAEIDAVPKGRFVLHVVATLVAGAALDGPGLVAAVGRRPGARLTVGWPFPSGSTAQNEPMPLAQVEAFLDGLPAGSYALKGLPPCALGSRAVEHAARVNRSSNRWYVDAEHQRDNALLFLPDVVRFSKLEACRFCAADARCDGAPEVWLATGRLGPLRPIRGDPHTKEP